MAPRILMLAAACLMVACDGSGSDMQDTDAGVMVDDDGSMRGSDRSTEPTVPAVRFVGRMDRSDDEGPVFAWSGSQIIARFSGRSVGVRLRGSRDIFEVVLDGEVQPVLATSSEEELYVIASDLEDGPHDILLHKRTEPLVGETQFLGFDFGTEGLLLAGPAAPDRRIELIGDSITAGYGNEGVGPGCPFTDETENHYLTYGAIAARELEADAITIAWSGKGVYRNFAGDMDTPLPDLYSRTLPSDADSRWDFESWTPDVVVLNVGTNDFASGTPPQEPFESAYQDFVEEIRARYPDAYIFCAIGPMITDDHASEFINNVVDAIGDERIRVIEFPVQSGDNGYGCDWHPSVATHRMMANQLVGTLRETLGW